MYSLVQAVLQFHYYKTGIPESKHLGGFPITGQFLTCTNPQVIEAHDAKVYGKEPPGTPPMTVPHLDARYIEGKRTFIIWTICERWT